MSVLAIYVAGPRAISATLDPDTLEPTNLVGDVGLITLEPAGDPPPSAPLCIECRRPARLAILGEALCESCLVDLRTSLNAYRDRVDDLEARLERREGP